MAFETQNWIPYGKKAKFVEINIKNQENQSIDFYKVYKDKTRDLQRVVKRIKALHDFDFNPEEEIEKEIDKEVEKKDKWLKKDMVW
jgi:hypothetical protein